MKALLEFNLPDDQIEFEFATNGSRYFNAYWEFSQWLRSQMKYHDHEMTEEVYETYDTIREKFYEFLEKNKVNYNMEGV